jgi:hypothetical protein
LDQFKDLLIETQLVGIEVGVAMQTTGVRQKGTPPAEFNKLFYQSMDDAQRSVDDEIKAFLTPPEYSQYLDYSEVLMPWIAVNALARTLQSTATPLADEQASQMVGLICGSRPKPGVPHSIGIAFGSGLFPNSRPDPITARVFEQAGKVLSVPQMDALRQIQQQWGFQETQGY